MRRSGRLVDEDGNEEEKVRELERLWVDWDWGEAVGR